MKTQPLVNITASTANFPSDPPNIGLMIEKMRMLSATLNEAERERKAHCQIAKYMREQGFDPDAGYILIFPKASAEKAGIDQRTLPPYCMVDNYGYIDVPVVIHSPNHSDPKKNVEEWFASRSWSAPAAGGKPVI